MIGSINEEVRVLPDVVTELLARIGEQVLLYDGCSAGFLPIKGYGEIFAGVHMWSDEERQLVVEMVCEPRRLVLDEILGWQWYNREGPEG